ncbi:MAG: heme lyase CcmF/NrfE family subunit [Phycisphaerales bacterium]|nr:heme lyase CcmF/NrfE family subunit [Phycisphaerales bacterium]
MTRWIGESGLVLAAGMAAVGVLAGLMTRGRGRGAGLIRAAAWGQLTGLALALGTLMSAFVRDDLGMRAVALHSERGLPVAYKVAAVWAGQEGSLLLWAFLLAGVGAIGAVRPGRGAPAALAGAVLAALGLFFAAILLMVADPFAPNPRPEIENGVGLNPMLQHWAMVVHPPTLFLGYACSAGPFALAIGGLVTGELGPGLFAVMRRWALASWVFLTGGILLGAWWAYVELGWGGYWAWDPVENASLMPWLAVTGLLHALLVTRERGSLRGWGAGLACLAFSLCVLGTTLTRSGLLVSVHAFGATTVGVYLLGLLVVLGGGSVGLLWARRGTLRSGPGIGGLLGRDGAVVVLHLLLCAMLVATLVGTLFPVVSGLLLGQQVSLGAPYYNRVVGSLGLAGACVMAVGPALGYGEGGAGAVRRVLVLPGALALAAGTAALIQGITHSASLVCIAIATVTPGVIGLRFADTVRSRRGPGEGWPGAAWGTLCAHRRRYGGQLAHAGLCLLLLGVCGSGLYSAREHCTIGRGEEVEVRGYRIAYGELTELRGANYSAMEARLRATDARGAVGELRPQRRYYDRAMDPMGEVAVWRRAGGDLYVVLAWWSPGGERAGFVVVINPLVVWVWVGGGVMAAGGFLAWLPLGRRGANNEGSAPAELASGAWGVAPSDGVTEP